MELHLLYSHVATVSSPSESVEALKLTPSELPAQEEVWQHLTLGERSQAIKMVDVTTRRPKMYHRVITLTLDITNELGHRIFDANSPLFGIIVMESAGYGWVARHPTLHALNIFWTFDARASMNASHVRSYNLIFDLDDTLIFNPPLPNPESTPALYYVNQSPPHTICDDAADTPVKRPHVQEFLALLCDHFKTVKVCTLSLRERARQIVELLDPQHRTLLKNAHIDDQVCFVRIHSTQVQLACTYHGINLRSLHEWLRCSILSSHEVVSSDGAIVHGGPDVRLVHHARLNQSSPNHAIAPRSGSNRKRRYGRRIQPIRSHENHARRTSER